jgi:hypothetical protein
MAESVDTVAPAEDAPVSGGSARILVAEANVGNGMITRFEAFVLYGNTARSVVIILPVNINTSPTIRIR